MIITNQQRDWGEDLLRLGGQQGAKWLAGAIGGGNLLLIVLFIIFMAAIAVFLGGGLGDGQGPPVGTALSRPALWLGDPAVIQSGMPNVVITAVMAHESGGRVLAMNYNCTDGTAAPQPCEQTDGSKTLSEDAGLMQINSGGWPVPEDARKWQSLGIAQDPFDPARNIPAGIAELQGDVARYGYLEYALEAYNSGFGGSGSKDAAYAAAVRTDFSTYEAGPTLSVWSTADFAHGQWTIGRHQQVWLVVVAAGPFGPTFSEPWAPRLPKCVTKTGASGKAVTKCVPQPPEKLVGRELALPTAVTANGQPMALSPKDAPIWPGEDAYALQVRRPGTYRITATWPGGREATAGITLAAREVGGP